LFNCYVITLSGWIEASDNSNGNILCYSKICQADSEYPYLERGIIIRADFSWHVQYAGQQVPYSDVFSCLPTYISSLSACNDALLLIDTLPLCCGNPDEMFAPLVEQRKGIFMNVDGKLLNCISESCYNSDLCRV